MTGWYVSKSLKALTSDTEVLALCFGKIMRLEAR